MARLKGQLSLEFLVYTAIVAAGLVSALAAFSKGSIALGTAGRQAYAQGLISAVASDGGYGGTFDVFVPSQLCNYSYISGPAFRNYSMESGISIIVDPAACANLNPTGRMEVFMLPNGTYLLK